jgi:hypothetical protein
VLAPPSDDIEMAPPVPSSATLAPLTAPTATPAPTAGTASSNPSAEADPLASAEAERASKAVMDLPGVQGMCAEAKGRGASSCNAWTSEAPSDKQCASTAVTYANEACWWAVALEEVMTYPDGSGHANRMATFWVEQQTFAVKAANDFACADMLFTLPAFRAMKVRRAATGKADDCDGAVPYPAPPGP